MKVTEDLERIQQIKDLVRRNCLGITPEDSQYIVDNICDIFHTMYFIIDEWQQVMPLLIQFKNLLKDNSMEECQQTAKE